MHPEHFFNRQLTQGSQKDMVAERFQVPEESAIRIQAEDMRPVVEGIFQGFGMPEADAKLSVDVLLYADIRGIDSHGVSNMVKHYEEWVGNGQLNPTPQPRVLREAPATVTIDGDCGLGLAIGPRAMKQAMEKAATCGIGAAAVVNVQHFGACAYHAALALDEDMIGVVMTTTGLCTAPTFGAEARLGSNPIGFAAPAGKEVPFIFDASLSSLPLNKVEIARRLGSEVPAGWIAAADGTPILQEQIPPEDVLILPLGGPPEGNSHKGYGLSVMTDVLAGLLAGGEPSFSEASFGSTGPICHHFLAYRVDAFTDLGVFKETMDRFLKALRETPPAPDCERVLYAGLPEHETGIERQARGIPYHKDVIGWFREAAARYGVPHPFG